MLTIISTLIGLLGSLAPSVINYLTANANNKYQLALIQLQMDAAAKGTQLEIDLANTKADIQQQQLLYSYDSGTDSGWFINALKGSVRPVITYALFLIWLNVELIGFFYGIHQGKTVLELIPLIWDTNTQAIFFAVIGFWFGGRILEQYTTMPPMNQPKASVNPSSKAAISSFQQAHGLTVDGIIGPQTQAAMEKK